MQGSEVHGSTCPVLTGPVASPHEDAQDSEPLFHPFTRRGPGRGTVSPGSLILKVMCLDLSRYWLNSPSEAGLLLCTRHPDPSVSSLGYMQAPRLLPAPEGLLSPQRAVGEESLCPLFCWPYGETALLFCLGFLLVLWE